MATALLEDRLDGFDKGLDELESVLEKIQPFLPAAAQLLRNLRRFREEVDEIVKELGDAQEDLEKIRGALGISEERRHDIERALDELLNFDDNELPEVERALRIAIALDGPNIFAQSALEKVEYTLRSPKVSEVTVNE
jgi:chromosome segregation ATPase